MASVRGRKRKLLLSIEQRFKIVKRLESGASINRLTAEYNVHAATIRRLRKNAGTLRELAEQGANIRRRKSLRQSANPEVDKLLIAWYNERKGLGEWVTNMRMLEKATELNKQLGGPSTFKASKGWLWRFKNRHGICSSSTREEPEDPDAVAAQQFVNDFNRRLKKEKINLENVYNLSETGLAWKGIPMRANAKPMKMDRGSVVLCTNATGSHKLMPLFIHKIKNPKELKHCTDRLPAIFKSQPRAWLDQLTFSDWYRNHFKPAVKKYQEDNGVSGKVILLVEKCRVYTLEVPEDCKQDNDFDIVFLIPSIVSILAPMEQWVTGKTKTSYRSKMLHRVITYTGGVREFYFDYDLKDCMDLLFQAWCEISVSNVRNAWKNIIKQKVDDTLANEEPDPLELSMQDIIGAITREPASEESVNVFLAKCAQEETGFYDEEEQKKEVYNIMKPPAQVDEEKMKKTFDILMKWARREPEYIREHVEFLTDYFE